MNSNLLLLSSSRVGDTEYLAHALPMIKEHLGSISELLFVPYAGVTISYNEYTHMVQAALKSINVEVKGIHQFDDPIAAIENAQAIAVGGGNTFRLLEQLYKQNIIKTIVSKVNGGMPYIGWSAGSNVAGKSIRTTNDMPIIEPPSFDALNLVNFQINPHYTEYTPPGHNGETREQRLAEFMVLETQTPIVGIVEGTALKRVNDKLILIGNEQGYLFKSGEKTTLASGADLSELL